MGIGLGIFLVAAGAILVWGVNADANGLDIDAIGVILMVVGLVSVLLSLLFWSSWGGWGVRRRTLVADRGYDDDYVVRELEPRRRTRVVEQREVDGGAGPPPA